MLIFIGSFLSLLMLQLVYPSALKMAENTRLGGIKQEFQEFKNSFQVMISDLKLDMERKFENTNKRLQELNNHLKINIVDQMNECVMSIKDTIIDALKEDNAQLRNKVELLRKKLTEAEIFHNKLEQYTMRNNIEIQGIPPQTPDEKLEEKVTEAFGAMTIAITKNDVEDCQTWQKFKKYYCPVCEQKPLQCHFKQEI